VVKGPKTRTGQHWYKQFFPQFSDVVSVVIITEKIFNLSQKTAPKKDSVKSVPQFLAKNLFLLKIWKLFNIGNLLQNKATKNFKVEILWKFDTKKLMVPLPVLISFYNLYDSSWNLTFVLTGPVLIFLWWLSNLVGVRLELQCIFHTCWGMQGHNQLLNFYYSSVYYWIRILLYDPYIDCYHDAVWQQQKAFMKTVVDL